jgi:hypothetical protein
MELFIAILEDRHTDTDVEPFMDMDEAIAWARKEAKKHADGEVDETLTDTMRANGWVYHGCYSCEGDNVRVVRKTLDAALGGR